jgi:hypothetical protein
MRRRVLPEGVRRIFNSVAARSLAHPLPGEQAGKQDPGYQKTRDRQEPALDAAALHRGHATRIVGPDRSWTLSSTAGLLPGGFRR